MLCGQEANERIDDMRVFISWSGDLSRAIAVELRDWLPMAVQQVVPWISGRDIDPGQRWALALGKELAESDFAVICITKDNLDSPWILFEAGAVARSLEARVVPVLIGVEPRDLDGPLAQFQSLQADRNGIERLVSALHDSSDSALESAQKDLVFERMWPVLEERLAVLQEQSRRTIEIVSPDDLVATLTATSKQQPATGLNPNVLQRLDQERKRIQQELQYLNEQEEELTHQDAPISLVDRAIAPTKQRLEHVESSVGAALDRTFAHLTPSQIAILRALVSPAGIRLVEREALTHYETADIEALSQFGLMNVREDGTVFIHDLVVAYVYEKFGAA